MSTPAPAAFDLDAVADRIRSATWKTDEQLAIEARRAASKRGRGRPRTPEWQRRGHEHPSHRGRTDLTSTQSTYHYAVRPCVLGIIRDLGLELTPARLDAVNAWAQRLRRRRPDGRSSAVRR